MQIDAFVHRGLGASSSTGPDINQSGDRLISVLDEAGRTYGMLLFGVTATSGPYQKSARRRGGPEGQRAEPLDWRKS